ncbi:MAG: DPP IV N-terminal domain-containing protein [Planctomycetota bacterium]
MNRKRRWLLVLALAAVGVEGCVGRNGARGLRAGRAESESIANPAFLEQYAATRRFSAGEPSSIKVAPDGKTVLFLRSGPRSFVQDLYEYDVVGGRERVLMTAEQILRGTSENLSAEELARRERMRLSARGITSYQLSEDGSKILVPLSDRLFVIHRASAKVMELKGSEGFPIDPRFSPDGWRVACVRNGDLYVLDISSGTERRLTHGANDMISHGTAEFVAQEEMDRREGYWWSPDSRWIAYQRTSNEGLEVMHIMDAMYPDRAPQSWAYPRPGKKNAEVTLGVIPATGGETTWVHWDAQKYPYLANVKWMERSPLTVLVENRDQTEGALLSVNENTGECKTLLVERDEAWLSLDPEMPHWLSDGKAFLWTTERNGEGQLELRGRDGASMRMVTEPALHFKSFVHLDESNHTVYFLAQPEPTETHLYRLSLDGKSEAVRLTHDPGMHSAVFAKDKGVYVHMASTEKGERIREVVDSVQGVIGSLSSTAEAKPFVPNVEFTTTEGNPGIHAAIVRPRNFEEGRKYQVIVYVYGGPGAQTVLASVNMYLLQQWIADHGFIVVSVDGRGTPGRGREWERVIKGNLIDVPLNDQVDGLQALGRMYRELDLSRVGIYGWSFGGYFSAMAVMRRPDVYHCGVAGAPVADWLDYDTYYTERFLGMPDANREGYDRSSVLTYAKDLTRPLLIIHGTSDDNVYFAHSLKMSNELFRAGKHHEFLALSGFTHMVADPVVTTRLYTRIVEFFQKNLSRP